MPHFHSKGQVGLTPFSVTLPPRLIQKPLAFCVTLLPGTAYRPQVDVFPPTPIPQQDRLCISDFVSSDHNDRCLLD